MIRTRLNRYVSRQSLLLRLKQNCSQDIPVEYRVSLANRDFLPHLLKSVSPDWLLSTLFTFIWTKLRARPTGEAVNQPEWPLKVCRDLVRLLLITFCQETLQAFVSEGEEIFCEAITNEVLCKHAVDLFVSINNFLLERQ